VSASEAMSSAFSQAWAASSLSDLKIMAKGCEEPHLPTIRSVQTPGTRPSLHGKAPDKPGAGRSISYELL
jgi:hypothetical protein